METEADVFCLDLATILLVKLRRDWGGLKGFALAAISEPDARGAAFLPAQQHRKHMKKSLKGSRLAPL